MFFVQEQGGVRPNFDLLGPFGFEIGSNSEGRVKRRDRHRGECPLQIYSRRLTTVLGEAKPGGFQTRVFPTFFGKGPDCVADPFGTVPRRCSSQAEKEKSEESGKSPDRPRANRENPRKIGKVPKRTKKDKKARSGNPPV